MKALLGQVCVYILKSYAPFELYLICLPFKIEEEEDEEDEDEEKIVDLVHNSESDCSAPLPQLLGT